MKAAYEKILIFLVTTQLLFVQEQKKIPGTVYWQNIFSYFGDANLSLYVAGGLFGEVQLSFFVAGPLFGDAILSLYVAGAICGEVQAPLMFKRQTA